MKHFILPLIFSAFSFIGYGQTIILSEDFETGALPAGWLRTQANPSVGWEFGTNLGSQFFPIPNHTSYAASNDDAHDDNSTTLNDASEDRLITPAMDLTPYSSNGVQVEFEYYHTGTYGSTSTVEVSTDGGATWNTILTLTAASSWGTELADLSPFTSSSSVLVAFRHNDGGAWADGFAVDDVTVQTIPGLDASAETINLNNYLASGNTTISATISNQGATTINSLLLSYTINGGTAVQETFSGLSIPFLGDVNIDFTTLANLSVGSADVCVNVLNVNGVTDDISANDQVCETIGVISTIPVKKSILERHTGSWCQFCPDGEVIMSNIDAIQPNTICVAVHNNDDMDIPDGNTVSAAYIGGFPSGTVDRYLFEGATSVEINRGIWESSCNTRNNMIVPLGVSIETQSYNSATRELTVTVRTDFVGSMSGDLRFNLFMVEDSVTGSGSGYDQVNFYNTQSGHPYFGAGNPIIGFHHNKVVREMLGGAWGTGGIIPASVNDGDSYTVTYNYTVPATYDETQMYVVGLVQKYDADINDREIINAEEVKMTLTSNVGLSELANVSTKVYPNPFSEKTQLEFNLNDHSDVLVEVYNSNGSKVNTLIDGYMNPGFHSVYWWGDDLGGNFVTNGEYFIVITVDGAKQSTPVILAK